MAKILEEGNYKFPHWSLEMWCMGTTRWIGQKRPPRPCYSKIKIEDGDVVKRIADEETYYGFICPKCKRFTEIEKKIANKIPQNVKEYAFQVASPESVYFDKLSDEEKKLSENL